MAIEFQCPACRIVLKVPDNSAGQKGRCPTCRQKIRVPQIPPNAGAPRTMAIEFRCPRCQATIRSPAEAAGQKGQCPQCQGKVRVPNATPQAASRAMQLGEGAYFGLTQLTTPATAADDDQYAMGIDVGAPEFSAKQMAKERGQGSWIAVAVPIVAIAVVLGLGAYLIQRFAVGLGGKLNGVQQAEPELEPVDVETVTLSEYGKTIASLDSCLDTDPIQISSGIMTLTIGSRGRGLTVGVTAGESMAVYRVDMRGDRNLADYVKKNAAALEAPRAEVVKSDAPEFLNRAVKRCRRHDASNDEFIPFRNSMGLATSVGGLGFHVQATAAGEAYRCVREAGPTLYFILPKGLKTFEISGREVPGSTVKFPGKYVVEVQTEAPLKPKGRPAAKARKTEKPPEE